ncbi:hypothetical protein HOY80DRAFT_533856 [Tuber brumale]|nr:hypothetical protein HOY80DRAFT_533856 [Tuber brumale]
MTISEAEDRLGLALDLHGIPVKRMLQGKRGLLTPAIILKLKRKIYQDLVNYRKVRGYPSEAKGDLEEAINDMVVFTIFPIIAQFKDEANRELLLAREKEITSIDASTHGLVEFAVMDCISYNHHDYVLVVEAKRVSLGEAIKQCFLSLRDMRDSNGGGTVYGFVTMGNSWSMISFDGTFMLSNQIELQFDNMEEDRKQWMANYSILVECFNVALSNGGKGMG